MRQQLINIARKIIFYPKRLIWRWKRYSLQRFDSVDPVVSFGDVLNNRSLIHGGAVKLLSLQHAMKNNEKLFNILYLVSSAQPPFAEDLVKRCRKNRIPFIWNQNGVGYPAWAGKETERHNAPMRYLRKQADYIIYQSQFCCDAAEKFLGRCSQPSEILFNPVDLKKFKPLLERPALAPLRLLTLGTHGYKKRVFSTLECLKVLRDEGVEASLTIAGKLQWSQGEASLYQEIKRLGLSSCVTILPAFHQEEAIRLYQTHHCVLHPKYLDPCPTVVIEALASGCPVIGSGTGGMPELVSSECGFLIPAEVNWNQMITPSGAELAEGVMSLLPCWESAAAASRARAELLFDEQRWVARHREIFKNFL